MWCWELLGIRVQRNLCSLGGGSTRKALLWREYIYSTCLGRLCGAVGCVRPNGRGGRLRAGCRVATQRLVCRVRWACWCCQWRRRGRRVWLMRVMDWCSCVVEMCAVGDGRGPLWPVRVKISLPSRTMAQPLQASAQAPRRLHSIFEHVYAFRCSSSICPHAPCWFVVGTGKHVR